MIGDPEYRARFRPVAPVQAEIVAYGAAQRARVLVAWGERGGEGVVVAESWVALVIEGVACRGGGVGRAAWGGDFVWASAIAVAVAGEGGDAFVGWSGDKAGVGKGGVWMTAGIGLKVACVSD